MSSQRSTKPVGFLPAAGRGTRFGASGYIKELYPLFLPSQFAGGWEPRPICELALRAIQAAGAERCVIVVSHEKSEILRILGNGAALGMSLAYVVQPEPRGLPHALRSAQAWLADCDVVFALPDTVVLPGDALRQVHEQRLHHSADLMLGIFPTEEPERLGPVELAEDGTVRRIFDKPAHPPVNNTWGVASWTPRFTEFCCRWDEQMEAAGESAQRERVLGHAIAAARESGLAVRGHHIHEGLFLDTGTPRALSAALRTLAERGILASSV